MKVTACVVSWNTAEYLPGVLTSLLAQTHPNLDVLVVDNASLDGSDDVVRGFPDVRLVANQVNRGFAGAANQGVALAVDADAFLVCNPDATLEPDYVARAVKALADRDRRAAVQGKLWRSQGADPTRAGERIIDTTGHLAFRTRLFRNRGEGQVDVGQFDEAGEVFGVSGALALYRVAALHDVACRGEVFDEDLFAFWEDVDLDWRLALRGWSTWYTPDACAWHERGGSGPRRSAVVERLNFVNRALVVLKNDHPPSLLRASPGVAFTTTLKAGELALTVPSAFLRSLGSVRLIPRTLERRRHVQRNATVAPAEVVARWFEPFDYSDWMRAWWRRVR